MDLLLEEIEQKEQELALVEDYLSEIREEKDRWEDEMAYADYIAPVKFDRRLADLTHQYTLLRRYKENLLHSGVKSFVEGVLLFGAITLGAVLTHLPLLGGVLVSSVVSLGSGVYSFLKATKESRKIHRRTTLDTVEQELTDLSEIRMDYNRIHLDCENKVDFLKTEEDRVGKIEEQYQSDLYSLRQKRNQIADWALTRIGQTEDLKQMDEQHLEFSDVKLVKKLGHPDFHPVKEGD